MTLDFFSPCSKWNLLLLVVVFTSSLLSLLLLWLFFHIHNEYDYQNNYQIINYSFRGYLLPEQ